MSSYNSKKYPYKKRNYLQKRNYKTTTKKPKQKVSLFEPTELIEWKNVDTEIADLVLSGANNDFSALQLLNGMAQGITVSTRIGRSCVMKSFMYRFHLGDSISAVVQPAAVRILCVYDRQPTGTTPSVGDVLLNSNFYSPMNLTNNKRFLIISDKTHQSPGTGNTVGDCYKKMNLEVVFSGTTAAIASISTGSVFAMFCTSGTVGATNVINFESRIRYTDA